MWASKITSIYKKANSNSTGLLPLLVAIITMIIAWLALSNSSDSPTMIITDSNVIVSNNSKEKTNKFKLPKNGETSEIQKNKEDAKGTTNYYYKGVQNTGDGDQYNIILN